MRKWIVISVVAVLVILLLAPVVTLHLLAPRLHALVLKRTEETLRTHFESQVQFSDFSVSLTPRISVTVTDLVMRHKGRTDIPPLFQIRKVSMYANLSALWRRDKHFSFVQLEGLQINTPPRNPGGEPLIHGTDQDLATKYPVWIDRLVADDAIITVLRAQPGKPPQQYPIHHLELTNLSFDRPADFHAVLTNALPKGEINATGQFGPWDPEEPSDTPANAKYTFENADLSTLKGLMGILSSTGQFTGPLDYLKVEGETDTPDFSLRTANHPIPLHTDFSAVVDGTNGDTYLTSVKAHFLHTTLLVHGKIVDEDRAIKGRTIVLDAVSQGARVEDLIRLAVKGSDPVMTGAVRLRTKIIIPEANQDLIERLRLQGQFGIDEIQFTDSSTQGKIDTLSRKGQGQPKDMDISDVESEMKGNFGMKDALVNFSNLDFGVTGASIDLSGTYNLDSEALDFRGKLMLKAKPSETTTGVKSFFMKAIDPFFKGQNAGTVLAIKITGTKDNPSFGLDHGNSAAGDSAAPKGQ